MSETQGKALYRKAYRLRRMGDGGKNIVVTVPKHVLNRHAYNNDMSTEQFIERFQAIAIYDEHGDLSYIFEAVS